MTLWQDGKMVRFTLFCRSRGDNMRMDFPRDDAIQELGDIVADYYGAGNILRNGYTILNQDMKVGECISDGDRIEVIPDPETYFGGECIRRP